MSDTNPDHNAREPNPADADDRPAPTSAANWRTRG